MPNPKAPDLDDDICASLKSIVDHFEMEDRATREWQIRRYKRLKLYWNNMSQIYWSETAQDYRVSTAVDKGSDDDQAYYDRPINIFKAFLETVIAALSIQIPAIICVPDDAENPMDLSTAKAGDKIASRVYKHNDVIFLWLQALYIYCTEGLIACYHYKDDDEKYGTYDHKVYKDQEIESYVCPNCQSQLADEVMTTPNAGFEDTMQEEQPEELEQSDLDSDILDVNMPVCPECKAPLDPGMDKVKLNVPQFDRIEKKAKTRICMDVYGGLYIKIANYAKKQCDTPYLGFKYETHFANVIAEYPHLRDKIDKSSNKGAGLSAFDPYEQVARLNPQYLGKYPENNVSVRYYWLRPASFYILPDDKTDKLMKKFPDGAMVCLINELVADYKKEKLDDRWTLTRNPLSDYLTHEPLGELLVNIQDIVNDLIALTIQTIEHGVLQTWADPAIVDFQGLSQLESAPGMITPTKQATAGKNISDGFYTSQAASLSPEVFNFYRIIQELAQFVSAAMPSIFGGSPTGKTSGTASEYAMSKSMALQRLQTPWRMITVWWKEIFEKVIPMYMEELKEDEKFVERDDQNRFVNVFIRKAETAGKIGRVELDASEQLPVSEDQKRDMVMQLMQLNNEAILEALAAPENLPFIRKVVRLPEFRLPGEDDRQKQYEEINQMLASKPIPGLPAIDQMTGQMAPGMPTPSVEVDPDVDNHLVEADICRGWLVSEAGRLAKIENPDGYMNIMLHMKQHLQLAQANMMAQAAIPSQTQPSKPADTNQVKGDSDVKVPIK